MRCSRTGILLSALMPLSALAEGGSGRPYATCRTFEEVTKAGEAAYPGLVRISDPGTRDRPNHTGFFFYQCEQFDATGRYALGMRIHFENREVRPKDRAEIGVIDLREGNQWRQIGETTAWNWQQGARLQWRPRSDEILWNDRSDDGASFVCRAYDFKTGARRVLPRPIYIPSPDGAVALTHDFERMKHGGTMYVGIKDKHEEQYAPRETGIWKLDLVTGESTLIANLADLAQLTPPSQKPGVLYVFREGWNPSGARFIAFLKGPGLSQAFSMDADGKGVRFLYDKPSHHEWIDDETIMDGNDWRLHKDDGSGAALERLLDCPQNGHVSFLQGDGRGWLISDTYARPRQYLFLYHLASKLYVPLAALKSTAGKDIHRIDLHPRLSRDGRTVCIDASYEGLGRQMYVLDIGPILDHPPPAPDNVR